MMESEDGYVTADDGTEVEIKVLASRFIGRLLHATDEAEARERLTEIRKTYHDARHHGSAWRVGAPDQPVERSDDDGEPAGTTGPPLLEVLRRAGLRDVVLVVTRYFGGTKLGKGGLVRAYGEAGQLAMDAAPRRMVWRHATVTFSCPYSHLGALEAVLVRCGADVVDVRRSYDPAPVFVVRVRRSACDRVLQAVVDGTAGVVVGSVVSA